MTEISKLKAETRTLKKELSTIKNLKKDSEKVITSICKNGGTLQNPIPITKVRISSKLTTPRFNEIVEHLMREGELYKPKKGHISRI